jgi:hypothetical protein
MENIYTVACCGGAAIRQYVTKIAAIVSPDGSTVRIVATKDDIEYS